MTASAEDQMQNGIVSFVSRNRPIAALALLIACLIMFLPGFFVLPPVDRDEARFVQATKQMHEGGDYLDIRNQQEKRYKKPIGIYWLQAVSTRFVGAEDAPIWAYRIPSLIGASFAVLGTWFAGLLLFGRRAAFMGALLLAGTILLGVEARLAKTDAFLLATIVIAQAVLAKSWLAVGDRLIWRSKPEEQALSVEKLHLAWVIVFWAALGVGILIKGPVILMIVGLTIVGLTVGARSPWPFLRLRPLVGACIMLAIALPWYVAISIQSDGAFLREAFLVDFAGKVTEGQEGHQAPAGSYAVAFLVTGWPMAAFVILGVPLLVRYWREPSIWFCLVWVMPSWIVFEGVVTKLPHYVLPLYPALALLGAAAMERAIQLKSTVWQKGVAILSPLVPISLTFAVFLIFPIIERRGPPPGSDLSLIAAVVVSLYASRSFWVGQLERAALASVATAALVYLGVYQFALPSFQTIWISTRLAALQQEVAVCEKTEFAVTGYSEISLPFLTSTDTEFQSAPELANWLADRECRIAVVENRRLEDFLVGTQARSLELSNLAQVSGYNFSDGSFVTLTLYARKGTGNE